MATTNLSALLLGELQSLSTEARRKHPDIKEAAERVIVVLRGIKATATEEIAEELSKSDEVIRPFVLACGSGNQRLTTIAVHCLQQLVSRRAISSGSVRETLSTLHHVSGQGVEIQVKVLQMILPLVTLYGDSVGGEALVDAFDLCLTLQRSRDPVVSNTAAAILRQAVVAVFDRVVAEDGHESCDMTVEQDLARRCAKDAYFVLQDLCLLAADAAPIFIRAEHHVDKRLVLELIESVLTNHAAVVARHAAMAQTLRERLAPFIVNFFAERSAFALAVRCTRIAWLFVRELHRHLTPECEILLSVLARLIDSRKKSSGSKLHSSVSTMTGGAFPLFYSVVALEVVHDLLETPALLHQLYLLYDGRVGHDSEEEDCHVILDLISAVCRVVVERSDLRASSSSIPHAPTDDALPAGDGSSLAVLSSDVVTGQQQQQQQIGARACRIRMELYKLLDKQEAPNVPDSYSFYLAASAIIGFGEGLAASILDSETGCGREFMRHAWTTAIYPVYEFIVGVRFDDAMFARMLGSAQRLVESAGILGLMEERDALLSLLCRGCLPTTQQSVGGDVVSSRQVQCVRAVIGCAQFLVSSLGPAWYMVLATVQCVEEALYANRGGRVAGATPVIGTSGSEDNIGGSGNQLLLSTDLTAVRDDFARLLAAVRRARGDAILWMIRGLQVLGSDLSSIQVRVEGLEDMRRLGGERLRGNAAVGVQVRPTFAVEELRAFAVANIDLLMGAVTDDESTNNDIGQQAWTAVVDHLLATATGAVTPAGMRTQACEAVSDVVLAAMDLVTTSSSGSGKFRAMVESGSAQVRILQPLSQMMATGSGDHHQAMTVRKLTLDTLHRVLQASGHSITAAWSVVFDIIQSVNGDSGDSTGALMRSVFPCLQLICTDYLADLPPACLRRCIGALLEQFGGGVGDLNTALTAIGQAWALCDYLHGQTTTTVESGGDSGFVLISEQLQKSGSDEAAVVAELWREELRPGQRAQQVLWLCLLHSLAQLGRSARRAEVRLGAIQTLFRAVDMHGSSAFDSWVWDGTVWAVVLPLVQASLDQRAQALDLIIEDDGSPEGVGLAEDPRQLLRRQWDESAAAALLGASRMWGCSGVWHIGRADGAWRRAWDLVRALLVGGDRVEWRLRSRDCVAGALASAGALLDAAGAGGAMAWRAAWEAWVAIGIGVTRSKEMEEAEDDDIVVTQDVLCAVMELGSRVMGGLSARNEFAADDCVSLLRVVRCVVSFADAPLYLSDALTMTRLQTLALDAVASSVDSPFSSALAVDEMATLAVLPFALSGQDALMGDSCVMKRAKRLYVDEPGLCQRMEAVAAAKPVRGRTAVAPTFEALGCAAAERLGALLSSSDDLAQQCLVDSSDGGAWLSSVVALGVHLVLRDSPWFVSAVPSAMQRLPAGPSLDAAWMAVGSVVDLALQAESASCESKRRMLDAVAESSVNSSEGSPRNYWELLLGAMERCALSGGKGELAGAGLGWLERLMAIGCVVPEWVACSAALRLVHCVRVIVDSYVADRALLTLGPLPLHRSQLLRRVVEGLADLQCRPKALNGKSNAAQHIVLVFDCLVGLVSEGATRDAALVRALQKCFQRVAKQVLC